MKLVVDCDFFDGSVIGNDPSKMVPPDVQVSAVADGKLTVSDLTPCGSRTTARTVSGSPLFIVAVWTVLKCWPCLISNLTIGGVVSGERVEDEHQWQHQTHRHSQTSGTMPNGRES